MGGLDFRRAALACAVLAAAACGGPVTSPSDAGLDSGSSGACERACDDGVFCNGLERCEAGSCVSGSPPCAATLVCDEEGARCVDPTACVDADGDGHESASCGGDDCDDADAARFPGNTEVCDARMHDEDCDPSTVGGVDEDGDGHVSAACCNVQPSGALLCGTDCDDRRASVRPDVTDDCNLTDDDCDGFVDEDPATIFYRDLDGDGYGRPGDPDDTSIPLEERPVRACGGGPGFSPFDTDCDDTARTINPAAAEVCADGIDNNCDGIEDADPSRPSFVCACTMAGEERACGGGASNVPPAICRTGIQTCQVGGTWSGCVGDVAPQTERCNEVDDDCDGSVDEGVQITCYADPDNDGFAEAGAAPRALCPIAGREEAGGCPIFFTDVAPVDPSTTDCDGADASVRPGAFDRCNLADDDCDGAVDEGADEAGCTNATAWGVCETGQCSLLACRYGRGDCDRVSANGCETDLRTSAAHCGGCGIACPLGATCRQGLCVDGITRVVAGGFGSIASACAIAANGELWCWGYNDNGQLGRGIVGTGSLSPAPIAASIAVADVDIGPQHACAATDAGEVWCWGRNMLGSLGVAGFSVEPTPLLVAGVSGAVQIGVGSDFSCARTSAGELFCWGNDDSGQLGNGSAGGGPTPSRVSISGNVVDFALGQRFGCALLDNGEVWCWGNELYGELGNGPAGATTSPVRIDGFDAVDVEAGDFQACAIRSSGELWCWGRNETAVPLGLSTYGHRDVPVHVPGVAGVAQVNMGPTASCARESGGALKCWMASAFLDEGASPTPRLITSLGTATQVAVGGVDVVYVLDDAGTVRHRAGSVSSPYGAAEVQDRRVRAKNGDLPRWFTGAVQISGGSPVFAVLASGQVAQRTGLSVPVTLVPGISDAWQVAAGAGFRCVLHQTGTVSCWGFNNEYQLGVTSPSSSTTPLAVPGVSDGVEIVAGDAHACVRRSDGRVLCWGANDRGQVGTGSSATRALPAVLPSLERVVDLSAGQDHTCAILASGELRCWGDNTSRQLGNASVSFSNVPLTVISITSPAALGSGARHQCVLDRGGRAQCWGMFDEVPRLVPDLYGARQLDGDASGTCAVQAGRVLCWSGLASAPTEQTF